MHALFSLDSPFNRFMTLVFDLVLINVLWMITSIPLFTLGASTTALYTVMLKRVRNNEGYVIRGFFKAFRENFRQSVPLALLFLLIAVVIVLDFLIVTRWESALGPVMQGLCYVCAAALAAVFSYVWPLMAKFINTNRNTLKNALILSVAKLPLTVLLAALKLLPLILFLFFPAAFSYVWWIWPLFGFSLTAYAAAHLLHPLFERLSE